MVGTLVVVGWVGLGMWNGDERRIGRRLSKLQKLAAKSPVESQLQGAAKAKQIAELFAREFELRAEFENFATSNRQDLMRGIIGHRARTRSLVVAVVREELFVDPGGTTAIHYAYVEFINDLGDLDETESYPVRVEWVKEGGDWMIRKLEVLPEARR